MDVEHPAKLPQGCLHILFEREFRKVLAQRSLAQIEPEIEGDHVGIAHAVDARIEPARELFERPNLPRLDSPAGAHGVPDDKGLVLRPQTASEQDVDAVMALQRDRAWECHGRIGILKKAHVEMDRPRIVTGKRVVNLPQRQRVVVETRRLAAPVNVSWCVHFFPPSQQKMNRASRDTRPGRSKIFTFS
jgi:hypothetical protein